MTEKMDFSGVGKSPNTSLSFRYNANNEVLEELYDVCEDDPPTPQFDASTSVKSENASPKRGDKGSSILDKYFKSMRTSDKQFSEKEKEEDKPSENKSSDENRSPAKEVTSSPMKEYLNRLGKRNTSETTEVKEVGSTETWKLFHDFKFKIAQAVEDMKTRSLEETKDKEKSVVRDSSISDSEDNSAIKDSDLSVGDTDNQVSSLNSSIQNLSELTQPLTARVTERELGLPYDRRNSESSDDTQKNMAPSETEDLKKTFIQDTNMMDVESGVEALEEGIDVFDESPPRGTGYSPKPMEPIPTLPVLSPTNFGTPPSKSNIQNETEITKPKAYFFNFTVYFLTFLLFVNYILFPNSNIWNGFLLGVWVFYLATKAKEWFLETYFGEWEPYKPSFFQLKRSSAMPLTYTIPSVKEHRPVKKYEGWINHFRFSEYDPYTYSINKCTAAFMKLEGCNLRLSYTKTKIPKRALWDEKIEKVEFYQHRLYNLTGAQIVLLPKGIVRRRHWSKKYPICIILNENEKIQVLEKETASTEKKPETLVDKKGQKEQMSQHEMESTETNTSPEKKKKFVWRRRERSGSTHNDSEPGREGLRHRLVRKMHRDKKPETPPTGGENTEVPAHVEKNTQPEETQFHDAETELNTKSTTSTKDDVEEDIDETELTRIKEFLEETELEADAEGTNEGEWSLHVKQSKDRHSCLFLFGRTGRDKHEWFRRLTNAINEANSASPENSGADDKTASETAPEGKDGIEMAVYKLSDDDHVAFARTTPAKSEGTLPEGLHLSGTQIQQNYDYEKTFWPFLLKIMQSKGGSCSSCECRVLPAEVTWVNTILARIMFDIMRDQATLARLQTRIQKKLHTIKLPSFMSPLVVTDLSLSGACPLLERVGAPAWDERGVWLDADLRYDGGAYITILTQINLLKLKEKNMPLEDQLLSSSENDNPVDKESRDFEIPSFLKKRKLAIYDSEVEDSAESSEDEDSPPLQPVDSNEDMPGFADITISSTDATAPASSKKKFLRMVDKIATNKYFQQVTEYKYVKRAMEGLSNMDIKLQVEVHGLEGRLAVNLPPPPHDRIWIGFRTNPQLVLKARPAVGARTLRFAHITNWIEQKLSKEFEKVLVLPNMEDILVDLMTPTPIGFK